MFNLRSQVLNKSNFVPNNWSTAVFLLHIFPNDGLIFDFLFSFRRQRNPSWAVRVYKSASTIYRQNLNCDYRVIFESRDRLYHTQLTAIFVANTVYYILTAVEISGSTTIRVSYSFVYNFTHGRHSNWNRSGRAVVWWHISSLKRRLERIRWSRVSRFNTINNTYTHR